MGGVDGCHFQAWLLKPTHVLSSFFYWLEVKELVENSEALGDIRTTRWKDPGSLDNFMEQSVSSHTTLPSSLDSDVSEY